MPTHSTSPGAAAPAGVAKPAQNNGFIDWPGLMFHAVDVGDPNHPRVLSGLNLGAGEGETNSWIGASGVYSGGGKVFFSHQTATLIPGTGYSIEHWLDVLDYADPENPVARMPVRIPAPLAGVSHRGEMVYAIGNMGVLQNGYGWDGSLQALAYDGTSARWVGSLPLASSAPNPFEVGLDGTIWISRPGTNGVPDGLESWILGSAVGFQRTGFLSTQAPVSTLAFRDSLLMVGAGDRVGLLDPERPAGVSPLVWSSVDCGVMNTTRNSAATRTDGLWIARGAYGVWHLPRLRP
jgi:hypothetical protein